MGFADYAGSGVVCITGGFAGLCGSYFVEPRMNIFNEDEDYNKSMKKLKMLSKDTESRDQHQKRFREK